MLEAPPPGGTIGILGGGQLGRMLALAAARLGLKSQIYSDEPNGPAADVAACSTVGSFADEAALGAFAESVDVVTCEFENVPFRAPRLREERLRTPPRQCLAAAQDRLVEDFMRALGIPVADYADVHDERSLCDALQRVELPAILKTRRFGYDGKGQALVRGKAEALAALKELRGQPALIERLVAFEREISVIVVRGQDGEMKFYDPVENVHQNGILAVSRVLPASHDNCAEEARRIRRAGRRGARPCRRALR
jgi:5-(carboxyamino)imidazole ribonucleotide synthase